MNNTDTKIQALQNAADHVGLIIHENFTQDKRKTTKRYFATLNGTCVSPVLEYENLNHFLLGWIKAKTL